MQKKIKALSLFANVGIAETYLKKIGVDVVLANELEPQRVRFYKHLYPNSKVITGDITKEETKQAIIDEYKKLDIDLIMATPPCQGMSTAGKKEKYDIRNTLVCHAIELIKKLNPKYVFLENVPEQLNTIISIEGREIKIPEYIILELEKDYKFNSDYLINACNYGVPQVRERAIILLVRKDIDKTWNFPNKEKKIITLKEVLKDIPVLDPEIYDVSEEEMLNFFPNFYENKEKALKISKWHYPPKHIYRQVLSLTHTPSGKSAFENIDLFKPKKADGTFAKGFKNTYKRQCWDKPAFTVTMYNRTIGSQNNVHPGHYLGKDKDGYDIYSDPRVLTIYELMLVSSLPKNWNIPSWASDHFIRQVIGEGIPPLLVKKIMQELIKIHDE